MSIDPSTTPQKKLTTVAILHINIGFISSLARFMELEAWMDWLGIQPVEIFKFSFIIWIADFLARKEDELQLIVSCLSPSFLVFLQCYYFYNLILAPLFFF